MSGKERELITKSGTKCWCSKAWLQLNAKHIVSCCHKVSRVIDERHDMIVNILLNNTLMQRGFIFREQLWEDRKMIGTTKDEMTVSTEHWRSGERKKKGRVAG